MAPSPSETAIPIAAIPPDVFWYGVSGGESLGPTYDSLAAIVEDADLIIEGTLLDIRPGRDVAVVETGEIQYQATLTVRADDTIKGTAVHAPDNAAAVQVEFLISFNAGQYDTWAKAAPVGDHVLLFLVNKGAEAGRLGLPPDAPGWGREYYAVRNTQGYVRDVDGIAKVRPEPGQTWLQEWSGLPFQDVLAEVRSASR